VRRLLQLVSALLGVIALVLVWRIGQVVSVQPPAFEPPAPLPANDAALPIRPVPVANPAIITAIVDGNLFEADRGASEKSDTAATPAEVLPPPTNVVLNGIMFLDGEYAAIVTDTKSAGTQLTVRPGEMVDVYEVGEIGSRNVTLLGPGGQKFAVALEIRSAPTAPTRAGVGVRPPVPRRPTPTRTAPVPTPTSRARPSPAVQHRTRANSPSANPAHSPRANLRARGGQGGQAGQAPSGPDPVQARLEALKRLREAAAAGNR